MDSNKQRIKDCWKINANPWIDAIDSGSIASRVEVTNKAIVDAVVASGARDVLDIGCGEGWLVRALSDAGLEAGGLDGSEQLISRARSRSGHTYFHLDYEDVGPEQIHHRYDALVCNFSLLDQQATTHIFSAAPHLLKPDGVLIVQTLHPVTSNGDAPYIDGWRESSWAGFGEAFSAPAPWYFRTIASWQQLFTQHGFDQPMIEEPIHPDTGAISSMILGGRTKGSGNTG